MFFFFIYQSRQTGSAKVEYTTKACGLETWIKPLASTRHNMAVSYTPTKLPLQHLTPEQRSPLHWKTRVVFYGTQSEGPLIPQNPFKVISYTKQKVLTMPKCSHKDGWSKISTTQTLKDIYNLTQIHTQCCNTLQKIDHLGKKVGRYKTKWWGNML